jgi:hypothetical protein
MGDGKKQEDSRSSLTMFDGLARKVRAETNVMKHTMAVG